MLSGRGWLPWEGFNAQRVGSEQGLPPPAGSSGTAPGWSLSLHPTRRWVLLGMLGVVGWAQSWAAVIWSSPPLPVLSQVLGVVHLPKHWRGEEAVVPWVPTSHWKLPEQGSGAAY